jgi:predicted glycoside hydrolase/deacetylase ChbG (UPF0249 family)
MPRESKADGEGAISRGRLIVNADDWGRDVQTTQMIHDCVRRGTVSSVSAMVFMEDSARAAEIAREPRIDAGLHLNFTTPFSSSGCPSRLLDRQHELIRFLQKWSFAFVIYHPWLVRSFEYVLKSQFDEYRRIYGTDPARIDGHHHMHLCSNVLLGGQLPPGSFVRRYFSLEVGQKIHNRIYRRLTDLFLARRYRLTDFFFSLAPIESSDRLQRIFTLARRFVVEVETHPVNMDEYRFLMGDKILGWTEASPIAACFSANPK